MFWEYGIGISTLEQLLEREEPPSLEEVLNESELLQELKSHNEKLINFLGDDENINKLVNYLVVVPPDNLSDSIRFKYPTLSCEILTSNIAHIDHVMFEDQNLLKLLWSVVKSPTFENYLIFSYAVKVITHYASFRIQDMCTFFKETEPEFMDAILQHVEAPIICDLVVRILSQNSLEFRQLFTAELSRTEFSKRLLDMITVTQDEGKITGSATLIVEIIRSVRSGPECEEGCSDDDFMLQHLLRDESLNTLVKNILDGRSSEVILNAGGTVLSALFNYQRIGHTLGEEFSDVTSVPLKNLKHQKKDYTFFLQSIKILQDIVVGNEDKLWMGANGALCLSLGRGRLLIIEALVSLMLHNNRLLAQEFKDLGTLGLLMEMFEKYPSNNFVHSQLELLICSILQGHRWPTLGEKTSAPDEILLRSLFEDADLVKTLLDLFYSNAEYSGHVKELFRKLCSCYRCSEKTHSKYISAFIEGLPEELKQQFHDCEALLSKIDEIEAADRRFLNTALYDEESSSDLAHVTDERNKISLDKGLSIIKDSKKVLQLDDGFEGVENCFEFDLAHTLFEDQFDGITISVPRLVNTSEVFDNVVSLFKEDIALMVEGQTNTRSDESEGDDSVSASSVVSPVEEKDTRIVIDNLSLSDMTSTLSEMTSIESSIRCAHSCSEVFHSVDAPQDAQDHLGVSRNFVRGATSSPILLDDGSPSVGEIDAFDLDACNDS